MKRKHFTKNESMKRAALQYMSRRDFLSSSLTKGAGTLSLPFFVRSMLQETSAYAEVANNGIASYPVVQIHLPGGWGGAVVPLDASGNPLSGAALGQYGVSPDILSQSGRIQSLFGIQYFDRTLNPTGTPVFDFTQGLIQKLPDPNPSNIQAFTVANNGQDDNATNPIGQNGVLISAGFKSDLVDAVGLSRTTTGMSNTSVLANTRTNTFIAPSPTDLQNLFSYAPALAGRSASVLDNFANALRTVGDIQARRLFGDYPKKDTLIGAMDDAHRDNLRFTAPNATVIDARQDAAYVSAFSNLFAANQALSANNQLATFATALKGLLMGHINFVGYTLPFGFDYHGQDILDANGVLGTISRDRIAGQFLGTVMSMALAANRNLIIVLTSDGACNGLPDHTIGSNNVNSNLWTGDRGQQNLLHFYAVNGGGANPTRRNGIQQVGAMRANTGTVDTSTFSGKGDMAAASVIAANILHLNGVSNDGILRIFPAFGSTTGVMNHIVLSAV